MSDGSDRIPPGSGHPDDEAGPPASGRPGWRRKRVLIPAALLAVLVGSAAVGHGDATPTARPSSSVAVVDQAVTKQSAPTGQQAADQERARQGAADQAASAAARAAADQAAAQAAADQAAAKAAADQAAAQAAAKAAADQAAADQAAAAAKAEADRVAAAQAAAAQAAAAGGSDPGTYTNADGNTVRRPVKAATAPAGATAQCRDGSWSFSQHRAGTCSGHHGVQRWL